jgi:GTP cyclohydrolase IA
MNKLPKSDLLRQAPHGVGHERRRPSREETEAAVRTLLAWAGDDPRREALRDTPARVADAYGEYFEGYDHDPVAVLRSAVFENATGYDDIVMLQDIQFSSHCEHHIALFQGRAHVAYMPNGPIVGLSRLARVVEVLSRRLQTQENLTWQIAEAIATALHPRGVAVVLEAEHSCMSARGVHQPGITTVTSRFLGAFTSETWRADRFLAQVRREGDRR